MAVKTIIVSYGCPRSGTTWMRKCLDQVNGAFVTKLMEDASFHPAQSKTGLLELHQWFHKERFVLVRTVRDPLEIAESFAATRLPSMRDKLPGLARNTPERVAWWIRAESEGTAAQRGERYSPNAQDPVPIVEVRYEDMASPIGRTSFVKRMSHWLGEKDRSKLARALASFGKRPARRGRLSEGMGAILTDEERAWYREQLADVIAREGYK